VKPSINPTTVAARRYRTQLVVLMIAYAVVLFATIEGLERLNPQGALRFVMALAPVVPVAFIIPAMARYFRDSDEFERRIVTEAFAIGAGTTAILSVTYGFLENAGLPHLSAWWTWSVVMGASFVARIVLNRRYQ
jgi:FtsH-binding integral membrane protein